MARTVAESTGWRDGGTAFAASQTILVLAPDPCRCGELVGALMRHGLPSLQATTQEEAMYWVEEESPTGAVLDLRTQRWRPVLAHLRSDGRTVVALTDDPRDRRMALEAGCLDVASVKVDAEELAMKVQGFVRDRRVVPAFRGAAGPLEVDLVEGRLRWRGREVPVQRQVLLFVAALVAHAGHWVSNPILLQELGHDPWEKPYLLHKTAWRLRRALGLPKHSGFLRARRTYGYGIFPEAIVLDDTLQEDLAGEASAETELSGKFNPPLQMVSANRTKVGGSTRSGKGGHHAATP